ncbi:hypothetical protein H105_06816 [Trichophyton soudanense CBS 452.61]|uniref:F-box domain-containing protein n=1 Tax=Trichophyton soudanense CBS 452.61 TaxID=1215331 RepID=A0A022XKT5_TRISD|nr:hypothetical protein H105_06816 [Trichophyton soudanense CBS 452.61]
MGRVLFLPAEIRCMIAEECDRKSLLSLSLVSTDFREPAQRALFRSIHETVERQSDVRALGRPGAINQYRTSWIQLLLRTILECPRFARYVRHVHTPVQDDWIPVPLYDDNKENIIQSRKRVVPRKFIDLGLKRRDEKPFLQHNKTWNKIWRAALFQGNDEAMLAVALSQFDLLTSIDISPELFYYSQFIAPMLACLSSPIPGYNHFPRLQHVSLFIRDTRHHSGELGSASGKFAIMKYHNIRTLELSAHDSHMNIMRKDLFNTHRYLTTLRLKFCDLSISAVGDILNYTPALKVFECCLLREYSSNTHQVYNHQSLVPSELDFGQLAIDLRKVAGTLEELTIGVSWSSMGFYAYEEDPSWFRGIPVYSLRHLEHLSYLEIPVEILIGLRPWTGSLLSWTLPPNLESLVLIDTLPYPYREDYLQNYSVMPVMNQLKVYLTNKPPGFRKVTVKAYVTLELNQFHNCEHEVRKYMDIDEVRSLAVSLTDRGITLEIDFHWTEYDEVSTLWRATYSPKMSKEVSNLGLRYISVDTATDDDDDDDDEEEEEEEEEETESDTSESGSA